jgi:hypothetical protein
LARACGSGDGEALHPADGVAASGGGELEARVAGGEGGADNPPRCSRPEKRKAVEPGEERHGQDAERLKVKVRGE